MVKRITTRVTDEFYEDITEVANFLGIKHYQVYKEAIRRFVSDMKENIKGIRFNDQENIDGFIFNIENQDLPKDEDELFKNGL